MFELSNEICQCGELSTCLFVYGVFRRARNFTYVPVRSIVIVSVFFSVQLLEQTRTAPWELRDFHS